MLSVLLGIVIGMGVTVFGLWCYIKGEQNGVRLAHGELPQQVGNPVRAVADAAHEAAKHVADRQSGKPSMNQQLGNLFNYNPSLPTDKEGA